MCEGCYKQSWLCILLVLSMDDCLPEREMSLLDLMSHDCLSAALAVITDAL